INDMSVHYPYPDQDENTTETRALIDSYYRYATLPHSSQISKTYLLDKNNDSVLPDTLKVTTTRTNTGGTIIENDIMNAFSNDPNLLWRREVIYDSGSAPDSEDVLIEIELPLTIMNDLNLNTISIDPHPEKGIEITSVDVEYNNTWQRIDGFNQPELGIEHLQNHTEKKKWIFAQKPVSKVRIGLKQSQSLRYGTKQIFTLGAQDISIYLNNYQEAEAFVLTSIDMSQIGMY